MLLQDLDLPVVNVKWYFALAHQRRERLSDAVATQWSRAVETLPNHARRKGATLLWMMEAFLQIFSLEAPSKLTPRSLPSFELRIRQLRAALRLPQFYFGAGKSQRSLEDALLGILVALGEFIGARTALREFASNSETPELLQLMHEIEAMPVVPFKVRLWQGWVSRTKKHCGGLVYTPLTPILHALGEDFTSQLDSICVEYRSTQRRNDIYAIRAISNYLLEHPKSASAIQLKDPEFTTSFFLEVYKSYVTNGFRDGEGVQISRLVKWWRCQVTDFLEERLFPSGLVAAPNGGLPRPRFISTKTEQTNIKSRDGTLMHEKLLTPVPLEVSDDQALNLIFFQIRNDFDSMKQWAWFMIEKLAHTLERRKSLAMTGTPRRLVNRSVVGSTDPNEPNRLANAAATFESDGYQSYRVANRINTNIYKGSRREWSAELGIPVSYDLVPHCAAIVAEHPKITPAFLESLELFDQHGKLCGLIENDSGRILVNVKLRRGPTLAEQEIALNKRSWRAVEQVILLTAPLRKFLKDRNDDNWRYLFLVGTGAMGQPRRMNRLASLTSGPYAVEWIRSTYGQAVARPDAESLAFAKRFSVPAVRATAGVLNYFETKSVAELAKTLGHAQYDHRLVERYLPRVIRQFFEERWIRIFQTGIIVQALEGSEYQLEASGFASIQDLHEFFINHALRLPAPDRERKGQSQAAPSSQSGEVIFGLNEDVLTTLLSLHQCLEASSSDKHLHPKARYWAEVTAELVPYIEASSDRPDIKEYLRLARSKASSSLVARIAYEGFSN